MFNYIHVVIFHTAHLKNLSEMNIDMFLKFYIL